MYKLDSEGVIVKISDKTRYLYSLLKLGPDESRISRLEAIQEMKKSIPHVKPTERKYRLSTKVYSQPLPIQDVLQQAADKANFYTQAAEHCADEKFDSVLELFKPNAGELFWLRQFEPNKSFLAVQNKHHI